MAQDYETATTTWGGDSNTMTLAIPSDKAHILDMLGTLEANAGEEHGMAREIALCLFGPVLNELPEAQAPSDQPVGFFPCAAAACERVIRDQIDTRDLLKLILERLG